MSAGRIQEVGHPGPFVLTVHGLRPDGRALCGQRELPFEGRQMRMEPLSDDTPVGCMKCQKIMSKGTN